MRKRIVMVALSLLATLVAADSAQAVQGICVECQFNGWTGRYYCYYINRDGYLDCFVFAGGHSCGQSGVCWGP